MLGCMLVCIHAMMDDDQNSDVAGLSGTSFFDRICDKYLPIILHHYSQGMWSALCPCHARIVGIPSSVSSICYIVAH
jgi:hypothetical protein